MKRNLLILLSLFVIGSCQKSLPHIEENQCLSTVAPAQRYKSSQQDGLFTVSITDAIRFAEIHNKIGQLITIKPFCIEKDTLLYFCYYDKEVLVLSGDKRMPPVLARLYETDLEIDDLPLGLKVWINSIADDVRTTRLYSKDGENNNTLFWRSISSTGKQLINSRTKSDGDCKWYAVEHYEYTGSIDNDVVPHLIQTKWGQGYPWNSKCPIDNSLTPPNRCYLGCTATATGQVLYYTHSFLGKPNGLYHDISCYGSVFGKTTNIGFSRDNYVSNSSRWNMMAADRYSSSMAISYAEDLMLDIGNRFGMKYSGSGSGAWPSVSALNSFYDISCYSGDYDSSPVVSNLYNGMPTIIVAFSSTDHSIGHTWIIDGLHQTEMQYLCYKHFFYGEEWYMASEYYDTWEDVRDQYHHLIQDPREDYICPWSYTSLYYLMNWGYDGSYDNNLYGLYSPWNANQCDHLYNRVMYYGFH